MCINDSFLKIGNYNDIFKYIFAETQEQILEQLWILKLQKHGFEFINAGKL